MRGGQSCRPRARNDLSARGLDAGEVSAGHRELFHQAEVDEVARPVIGLGFGGRLTARVDLLCDLVAGRFDRDLLHALGVDPGQGPGTRFIHERIVNERAHAHNRPECSGRSSHPMRDARLARAGDRRSWRTIVAVGVRGRSGSEALRRQDDVAWRSRREEGSADMSVLANVLAYADPDRGLGIDPIGALLMGALGFGFLAVVLRLCGIRFRESWRTMFGHDDPSTPLAIDVRWRSRFVADGVDQGLRRDAAEARAAYLMSGEARTDRVFLKGMQRAGGWRRTGRSRTDGFGIAEIELYSESRHESTWRRTGRSDSLIRRSQDEMRSEDKARVDHEAEQREDAKRFAEQQASAGLRWNGRAWVPKDPTG